MSSELTITIPEGLRREIERLAAETGVTPEQFVAVAAAEKAAGAETAEAFFAARRGRGDRAWFDAFMSREGGEPPGPGDERV